MKATGRIAWYDSRKGYGFIERDDGGADVFVHISAVEKSALENLSEGQRVSFEVKQDPKTGKAAAVDLAAAP